MGYEAEHASALADITEAGTAVTFTQASPGTYDAATDTWTTPVETTVAGFAIQTRGNPDVYRELSLVESKAPTILFAPTTFGEIPDLGYTVTWSGVTYTVKQIAPVQPDGNMIIARIVIGE